MTQTEIDPQTFAELQETAGADFVRELVETFLVEAPLMLAELRGALAAGELASRQRARTSFRPAATSFITAPGSTEARRERYSRPSVNSWETLTTEGFGRPLSLGPMRTFPGACANRRFEVTAATTTV